MTICIAYDKTFQPLKKCESFRCGGLVTHRLRGVEPRPLYLCREHFDKRLALLELEEMARKRGAERL